MPDQYEKAKVLCALHEREGAFTILNPYDAGTAKLLERLRFEALWATSAGFAFTVGRRDNAVSRESTLEHCADIAAAFDLPVIADLGNCFGDAPEIAAETIRLAQRRDLSTAQSKI